MRGISWLAASQLAAQEGLCTMEYKDKLQNCSCNQFHYIATYKQVETKRRTNNRGGNNGSEKWIRKNHCGYRWANLSSTWFLCLHGMCTVIGLAKNVTLRREENDCNRTTTKLGRVRKTNTKHNTYNRHAITNLQSLSLVSDVKKINISLRMVKNWPKHVGELLRLLNNTTFLMCCF